MINKTLESKFDSTDDPTRFTATITTNAIDRDGEVVIPAGMNSKEYERNPVLLYAHDAAKPIGKMLGMRRNDDTIAADFALAPRPETHEGEWLPDTVAALMRFGALRGVSIGFAPQPGGMRVASKADTERYGTGVKRVFSKWTLYEVSVVAIPANQQALISAVEKGVVSSASVKALGLNIEDKAPAKPSERIEGSDRNPEGSASGQRGGIEIDEATEEALRNKVDEHNEKHGDDKGKRVTLGMLKAVYRRGAGAFSTSHRPGMQRGQWAMARVNAFLTLVRRGRPENPDYTSDYDLLPAGHPKKTDSAKSADNDARYIVALTMQHDEPERTDALQHCIKINLPPLEDQAKRLAQIVRARATGKFRI
jgi:HK97 family phage prohead protease